MTHTPGPWRVGETRHDYDCVIRNAENDPVCVGVVAGYSKRTARANARLMAAAPEMLEALKAFLRAWRSPPTGNFEERGEAYEAARTAIAKAEGRDG